MYPDKNGDHPPEEQPPPPRPEGPPLPAPEPTGDAPAKLAYARWLAERVLQGIHSDGENVRNMLYWVAQANLTLGEVVSALLDDRPPH
jgi:hypothetical protein